MDNRGKRQAASIFGGMGFYIALLVCVVAAGVVGYFALLKNDTKPVEDPVTSAVSQPEPAQSVTAPDPEPAKPVISDQPVTVIRPEPQEEEKPEPAPETPASAPVQAPAAAQEPMAVVPPLAGETAAAFSIDQLAYDATLGDWRTHDGIDIRAEAGTAVLAAAPGTVLSVEEDGRLGGKVVIDHGDGYVTTYASLQPEVSVHSGDAVEAGSMIGLVGNTSLTEAGLGAHLHFSVTKDGEAIDPAVYLGE